MIDVVVERALGGARLDAPARTDHGGDALRDRGEGADTGEGQNGRSDQGSIGRIRHHHRQAGRVGMDLQPQFGLGRAAADDDLPAVEAGFRHAVEDAAGSQADPLDGGTE